MAKSPDAWSKRVLIKIIPHDARSIYKLELTHGHLAVFAACLVAIFATFLAEHIYQVRAEEAKVRELQRVNAAQQQQLVNFSNQTNHMWRQLNEIQQAHQEIQLLTAPAAQQPAPGRGANSKRSASNGGTVKGTAAGEVHGAGGQQPQIDGLPQHAMSGSTGPMPVAAIDSLPLHGPWWAQAAAWLGIGRGGVTFEGESASLAMLDAGMDRVYTDTLKLKHEAFKVAQVREEAKVAYQRILDAIPSIWPTDGSISSGFGYRTYPDVGFHTGVDIVNYYGAPIYATAAGTVMTAGWDYGYGQKVEIDHGNGYITWYGHNSALLVSPGEFVHKGQLIARLGATGFVTGPHVHYEVHQYGRPIDPVPFLSGSVVPQVQQFAQNAR